MHNLHRQVGILGAFVDRVTIDEALLCVDDFVSSGAPHQVTTVNVDFVRLAQENLEFRAVINRSDLAIADGMPLVWASNWFGDKLPERVTGVELVEKCCALAVERDFGVFLLGGEDGVAAAAGEKLKEKYPGLRVVGAYSPPVGPFSEEEDRKMVAMIQEAQPHFLFVAFGAPKQDLWIAQHQHEIRVPMAMGVGGVFNFLTGRVKRAPLWMQQRGLEWFYRVICEPRRLWRRYFINDLPIVAKLVGEAVRMRLTPLTPDAPNISTAPSPQPQASFADLTNEPN